MEGEGPVRRYGWRDRWTGVMSAVLGTSYHIIEEGLSGRASDLDDPADPRLNGSAYLPSCLASHLPLDLVIVMLGSNDLKVEFDRAAVQIAGGLGVLLDQIERCGDGVDYPCPEVLLVAPPAMQQMPQAMAELMCADAVARSERLSEPLRALALDRGVHFADAGTVISEVGVDGIHFTQSNNRALGLFLADEVSRVLDKVALG